MGVGAHARRGNVNPHREPGERDDRADVEPLHKGPRSTCPFCGASNVAHCSSCETDDQLTLLAPPGTCERHPTLRTLRTRIERVSEPRACSPERRVRWGVLRLRRCRAEGTHLHQQCLVCAGTWLCAPLCAPSDHEPTEPAKGKT